MKNTGKRSSSDALVLKDDAPIKSRTLVLTPAELAERVSHLHPDYHDATQGSISLNYTEILGKARHEVLYDLSRAIGRHLRPYINDKRVLEIGPGIFDLLFAMTASHSAPSQWTALDIHPGIVDQLAVRYFSIPEYSVVQGTVRKLPFSDGSYDVVAGLCSLDSIVDFDSVTTEIHRVLRPNGILLHIQDQFPSHSTIMALASRDPHCMGSSGITFHFASQNGWERLEAVEVPGKEPINTVAYLHVGLAAQFERHGLREEEIGFRYYRNKGPMPIWIRNLFIDKSHPTLGNFPYSYLVMRKTA